MQSVQSTNAMVALTHIIVGIVFVLVAYPLIQESVAPNDTYGIRIEETLSDDEVWYRVNKMGGYAMALAGFCTSFLGLLAWRKRKQWKPAKMGIITVGGMLLFLTLFTTIAIQMAI
ncbi:MAG: hypothetical protein SchgKO_08910 [Schleiferiaceae bacterium]